MKYLWPSPLTLIGLVLVLLVKLTGGSARMHAGIVEAHGGIAAKLLGMASAATLGHVIIARNVACRECWRGHEIIHVRQMERWGVLFVIVYAAAVMMHGYRENAFEREAYGRVL